MVYKVINSTQTLQSSDNFPLLILLTKDSGNMDSAIFTLLGILGCLQVSLGGYAPAVPTGGYYPYPSFVNQPVFQSQFLRPVTPQVVQFQQQRPLQLRPPGIAVSSALPNTRPPVVAIHAQPRPTQIVSAIPVSPAPIPVVAVQAPPRKIVLPVTTAPNYSYAYSVKDATTGDEKSHEETRTGDNVVGRYTVVEPDGTLRTVTYTAGVHGFNAVVERTPGYAPPNAPPPKAVAISRPVAIAAPIAVARPVAIASPVAVAKPVGIPVSPVSSIGLPTFGRPVAVPAGVYPPGFHFGG